MNSRFSSKMFFVILFFWALAGLISPVMAQDCWDYATYLHWLSEMEVEGRSLAVAAKGDYLFVANEQEGLQVISVVDPAFPTMVHTVSSAANARDVVVGGDFAFVAAGVSGLQIIDIADPVSANAVATISTAGPASGVFLKEDLILVAVENFGLQIFDVSDAADPRLIRSVSTPGSAYGVTANRYLAYVADGVNDIQVIDMIDPAGATLVASIKTPGNAKDVVARERRLYVADGGEGLTVIEREPTPLAEAFWSFSGSGSDLTGNHPASLVGEAEFVEIEEGFLQVSALYTANSSSYAEYAPPITEIYMGRISFVFKLDAAFTSDPSFNGTVAIVMSDSFGFNAGDCSVALDPVDGRLVFSQDDPDVGVPVELRTNLDTWNAETWYRVEFTWDDLGRDFQISWSDSLGSHFDSGADNFVSPCFSATALDTRIGSRGENAPPTGLTIDWLKVEELLPGGQVESTLRLEGFAHDLVFTDNRVFVALEYGDLQVVDFTSPSSPVVVGMVDVHDHARGLAVTAEQIFVVDLNAGLQVISYTTPATPERYSALPTSGFAYGMAIQGETVYIADRQAGLLIVDITVPTVPLPLFELATAGNAMDVAVAGNHAYVAEANLAKNFVESLPVLGLDANAAAVEATWARRAVFPKSTAEIGGEKLSRYSGLQIVDITNPLLPVVTGTVETPGFALDVEVAGNFVYMADFTDFLVIDVTVPQAPAIVGTLDTPGQARDLAISGNHAFVADLNGLQIIDISVPAAPQLVGSLATPGPAYGVAVSGTRAYVADVVSGLHVIDVSDPTAPVMLGTAATPGGAFDVEIIGNFAYVCDGFDTAFASLQIVDVSESGNPRLVGSFATPGPVYSVAVEGDYAFVTDSVNDLQILGRQCDPGFQAAPGLTVDDYGIFVRAVDGPVEITPGLDLALGVVVKNEGDRSAWGQVAFEYEDKTGVRHPIANTSVFAARKGAAGSETYVEVPWTVQAANPVIHVSLREVEPTDGDLSGNHVQRTLLDHTLTVYPSQFTLVNEAAEVSFGWNPPPVADPDVFRLVGTSGEFEWEIPYGVDDRGRFFASDEIDEQYTGQEVVYSLYYREPGRDWVLIALEAVDFKTPRIVTRLVGSYPNPFNPRTTISFAVEHSQQVQIKVFDVAGRLVSVLIDRRYDPGYHTVNWNGENSAGQGVSSGVYFLLMEADAVTDVQKLTLVR